MNSPTESKLDAQWAKEAEDRLGAYKRGEIRAIPLKEVLTKYSVKPASALLHRR